MRRMRDENGSRGGGGREVGGEVWQVGGGVWGEEGVEGRR